MLLLGLRESRRRAEAGKPHTLTPPLMVGAGPAVQRAMRWVLVLWSCCPCVSLFVYLQVGVQLLLLYMLYFFTGMLLRESVLKVRDPVVGLQSAELDKACI